MNEQELVDQLAARLDHPSNGSETDALESADLLVIARHLTDADFSADSRIRDSLRTQLANQQRSKSAFHPNQSFLRGLATASAVLVIVVAATLTIAPLRALAQQVLAQVGFITLTNAQPEAELWLTATPVTAGSGEAAQHLTLDQAEAVFGAPIDIPSYLPAGYVMTNVTALHDQVSTSYSPDSDPSHPHTLWLIQFKQGGSTSPYGIGNTPIMDVKIGDLPGEWVENAPIGNHPAKNGGMEIMPINLLTWKDGNKVFWMESFSTADDQRLSLDEMLKIAASLQAH